MNVINNYDKIKDEILLRINQTIDWLNEGETFGISFEEEKNKLRNLKDNLEDSKIKIALVGAFSEGKTTMAASWLGKVEDDMKIHHEESSDAICTYKIAGLEDKCSIIDTPGLFGSKSIEVENGAIRFREITEKYISEAHLILYVINPLNLMKDSHKETCQWLFRDLGKLENTVFVINKFDELVDLDEEDEYYNQFVIKKESFLQTLDRFIELSDNEKEALNVIAISANPYGEGLDYWFNNQEEFESISRIENLRKITDSIITNASTSIYTNQIKSVISDLVLRKKNEVVHIIDLQQQNIEQSNKSLKNIKRDLGDISKEVSSNFTNLKKEIFSYLADLKIKVRNSDSETLGTIFDKEIGEEGCMLDINLDEILNRYISDNLSELKKVGAKIEDEINFSEKIAQDFAKNLINKGLLTVKSIPISNMRDIVLASRDTLAKTINSLGGNVAMKFKPWGALKLAKGIGAAATGVMVLIEIYIIWKSWKEKKKFDEAKENLLKSIKEIKVFYSGMFRNEGDFKENYFPQIKEYSKIYENLRAENEKMKSMKQKVEDWFMTSSQIQDVDFEIIE